MKHFLIVCGKALGPHWICSGRFRCSCYFHNASILIRVCSSWQSGTRTKSLWIFIAPIIQKMFPHRHFTSKMCSKSDISQNGTQCQDTCVDENLLRIWTICKHPWLFKSKTREFRFYSVWRCGNILSETLPTFRMHPRQNQHRPSWFYIYIVRQYFEIEANCKSMRFLIFNMAAFLWAFPSSQAYLWFFNTHRAKLLFLEQLWRIGLIVRVVAQPGLHTVYNL